GVVPRAVFVLGSQVGVSIELQDGEIVERLCVGADGTDNARMFAAQSDDELAAAEPMGNNLAKPVVYGLGVVGLECERSKRGDAAASAICLKTQRHVEQFDLLRCFEDCRRSVLRAFSVG